jgi:DNA-binding PadR family transcriptional regulator
MTDLPTTSFAILGQLALGPRSPYELTKEMRRNVHYFWPHAESGLYVQVKRLANLGLATVEPAATGRRRRSVYSITPRGLEELERWLSTEPQRFALEFEGLLRALFAPFGTRENLLASLAAAQRDAEEILATAAAIREEYLAERAPFQRHAHVRAFVYDLLWRQAEEVRTWAQRARSEVETWDDMSPEGKGPRALAIFSAGPKH